MLSKSFELRRPRWQTILGTTIAACFTYFYLRSRYKTNAKAKAATWVKHGVIGGGTVRGRTYTPPGQPVTQVGPCHLRMLGRQRGNSQVCFA